MATFDHGRIDQAQPIHRQNARSVMMFTYLVMDYMEHLRNLPAHLPPRQSKREEKSAKAFGTLINTDVAWPIAKQYMSAAAQDPQSVVVINNQYLKSILAMVEHRRESQTIIDREDQIQQFETELLWRRLAGQVEFIASLREVTMQEREQDQAKTLDDLSKVFPLKDLATLEMNELEDTTAEVAKTGRKTKQAAKKPASSPKTAGIPTPIQNTEKEKNISSSQESDLPRTQRNHNRTKAKSRANPGPQISRPGTRSKISKSSTNQQQLRFRKGKDVSRETEKTGKPQQG